MNKKIIMTTLGLRGSYKTNYNPVYQSIARKPTAHIWVKMSSLDFSKFLSPFQIRNLFTLGIGNNFSQVQQQWGKVIVQVTKDEKIKKVHFLGGIYGPAILQNFWWIYFFYTNPSRWKISRPQRLESYNLFVWGVYGTDLNYLIWF